LANCVFVPLERALTSQRFQAVAEVPIAKVIESKPFTQTLSLAAEPLNIVVPRNSVGIKALARPCHAPNSKGLYSYYGQMSDLR